MKNFIIKRRQLIFNVYLAINFTGWAGYNLYISIDKGNLNYVELSYTLQNIVMITLILIRWEHKGVDKSIINQSVALITFLSGAAFMGQPESGGSIARSVSNIVVILANLFGLLIMLNLGRSFGILIAFRRIKTGGFYSVVRHPMYGTDILLRIGFITSHLNLFTCIVFIISTLLYVHRAILEERFLILQPEYRNYMRQVKYRFIPYIF